MPAVDAPDPGGIAFAELEILLAGLVDTPHCLGVELTVFDPDYDPDGAYAAEIVNTVVAGLAPVSAPEAVPPRLLSAGRRPPPGAVTAGPRPPPNDPTAPSGSTGWIVPSAASSATGLDGLDRGERFDGLDDAERLDAMPSATDGEESFADVSPVGPVRRCRSARGGRVLRRSAPAGVACLAASGRAAAWVRPDGRPARRASVRRRGHRAPTGRAAAGRPTASAALRACSATSRGPGPPPATVEREPVWPTRGRPARVASLPSRAIPVAGHRSPT